jgi:hypothetical protein
MSGSVVIFVFVDPQKIVGARDAGTTTDRLHAMSYMGEVSPVQKPDLGDEL